MCTRIIDPFVTMLTMLKLCLGACKSSRECVFGLCLETSCQSVFTPSDITSPFLISALLLFWWCSCLLCSQLPKLRSDTLQTLLARRDWGHGLGQGRVNPAGNWTGSGHQHRQGGGPRMRCALSSYPRGGTPCLELQQDVTTGCLSHRQCAALGDPCYSLFRRLLL